MINNKSSHFTALSRQKLQDLIREETHDCDKPVAKIGKRGAEKKLHDTIPETALACLHLGRCRAPPAAFNSRALHPFAGQTCDLELLSFSRNHPTTSARFTKRAWTRSDAAFGNNFSKATARIKRASAPLILIGVGRTRHARIDRLRHTLTKDVRNGLSTSIARPWFLRASVARPFRRTEATESRPFWIHFTTQLHFSAEPW